MCSGSKNTTALRSEQTRLANISKIKSQQAARKGSINVLMGGQTKDYRRSIATGAKDIGMSTEDLLNLKMSNQFTANMGNAEWQNYLKNIGLLPKGDSGGEASNAMSRGGGLTIGQEGAFEDYSGGDTSEGIGYG